MAPKASTLKNYLDESGELPQDVLLGNIVLFTINDGEYSRDQVAQWFDELMLNPEFIPEPNKAVDAYKKATSEADDFEYALHDGNSAHLLVRDVDNGKEMIVRHLVREVRDSRKQRLAYAKIGEAVFYRPSVRGGKTVPGSERFRLTIDNSTLLTGEREAMQEPVVAQISRQYARYVDYMDGMKVRAMVREYVKHLNSVALKPGVYFVHVSRKAELDRLATLVDRLGHGCFMHLVPLVDLEQQRDRVIEAFQVEAEHNLAEIVAKIQHVRASRKSITPDAYAKLKREYDQVINRAMEYTRTLNVSQDRTAGAAEVALDALVALQTDMLGGNAA